MGLSAEYAKIKKLIIKYLKRANHKGPMQQDRLRKKARSLLKELRRIERLHAQWGLPHPDHRETDAPKDVSPANLATRTLLIDPNGVLLWSKDKP
jgi:hypothetical protein